MITLRRIKHNFLIKLMTSLGFGGMVGFCLSSCDSVKTQDSLYKIEPNQPLDTYTDKTPIKSVGVDIVQQEQPRRDMTPTTVTPIIKKYGIPRPEDPSKKEELILIGIPQD